MFVFRFDLLLVTTEVHYLYLLILKVEEDRFSLLILKYFYVKVLMHNAAFRLSLGIF